MGQHVQAGHPRGLHGGGEGQFNEPWGIAVGQDGSVYVSDTWNHRVQKFDQRRASSSTMWGVFGSTGGELGQENLFYGPRSVAVGRDGNCTSMDTGNKRVQVFSPDGDFVSQFGGGGVVDGRFDEPVGLAQDADGNWYVADTWNQRIQKFDEAGQYVAQWPVTGWDSQSVVNKPALAVDPQRKHRVCPGPGELPGAGVRHRTARFKATWGLYGNEPSPSPCPPASRSGRTARCTSPTATRTGSWCSRRWQ